MNTVGYVSIVATIILLLINGAGFALIKFNDLKHLDIAVKDNKLQQEKNYEKLDKTLDKIFRRLGRIEKNQVKRDAVCEERHPRK